jgi:hypothetical protein
MNIGAPDKVPYLYSVAIDVGQLRHERVDCGAGSEWPEIPGMRDVSPAAIPPRE